MTSLERMLALLAQTNLYHLEKGSTTYLEFKQYGFYFDNISAEIDALLDNCFVQTISPAGYDSYMKLYSLPEDIDWDLMKDIVNRRLAVTNRDFTHEGVKRCLASGGLDVRLTENFITNRSTVTVLSDENIFGSIDARNEFIKGCMPCHTEVVIV